MGRYDIKMQRSAVKTKKPRKLTPLNQSYVERDQWYRTPRWEAFRIAYLKENPHCVKCLEAQEIIPATVVDHVDGHDPETWKMTFWNGGAGGFQGLCQSCHSRKTMLEDAKKKPKRLTSAERETLLKKISDAS